MFLEYWQILPSLVYSFLALLVSYLVGYCWRQMMEDIEIGHIKSLELLEPLERIFAIDIGPLLKVLSRHSPRIILMSCIRNWADLDISFGSCDSYPG
jgi:hypothetical protein